MKPAASIDPEKMAAEGVAAPVKADKIYMNRIKGNPMAARLTTDNISRKESEKRRMRAIIAAFMHASNRRFVVYKANAVLASRSPSFSLADMLGSEESLNIELPPVGAEELLG
jgi:hypothetical protein